MFKTADPSNVAAVQVEAYWPRRYLLPLPPKMDPHKVDARINHGRWIADCPFCSGAEMVTPTDPRFFCMSCDNREVGGKWLGVRFPKEANEIEEILGQRVHSDERNWTPAETVKDLRAEDVAMKKGVRL